MTITTVRPPTDTRRVERHAARRMLWAESTLKRVRSCGHHAIAESGVGIKATGSGDTRSAGFSGLASCGSVWACPVCSAKVSAHRQAELRAALVAWSARGADHRVAMITLTMRHRDGQALAALWDGNSYGWAKVTSGRCWKSDQDEFGVHGWCRVVEVTHGANGWHVHVHALLFLVDDQADQATTLTLGRQMFGRWSRALVRKGFAMPLLHHYAGVHGEGVKRCGRAYHHVHGGLDARLLGRGAEGLADYFTKTVYSEDAASLEIARGDLKAGRNGNRSPFQILRDIRAAGDADDLDLWHEWEAGSRGRRQMTWSKGLRDDLVATPELTDDEVAELDHGGDLLVLLDPATWSAWRDHAVQLLRAAEDDDDGTALRLLLAAGPPD